MIYQNIYAHKVENIIHLSSILRRILDILGSCKWCNLLFVGIYTPNLLFWVLKWNTYL